MTRLVYATTGDQSALIAELQTAYDAARAARQAWEDAFNREHPDPDGVRRELVVMRRDGAVRGITAARTERAPSGWRVLRDCEVHAWAPNRTTKIGKAVQAEFNTFAYPDPRKAVEGLGMPSIVMVGHHFYECGVRIDPDAQRLLVGWGSLDCQEEVDDDLRKAGATDEWRVLSKAEYEAWREAQAAKKAAA